MMLILDTPADFVVQLLSVWLELKHVSKLDVAMCSAENRARLGAVYDDLIVKNYSMRNMTDMEKQLDWLLIRKVRLRCVLIEHPLPRSVFSKVAALLKHSQTHLHELDNGDNDALLATIAANVIRYCPQVEVVTVSDMKLCSQFFTMLESLQNLHELTLFQCEQLDVEHLSGLTCPSLKVLTLHGNYSTTVQKAVLRMCPELVRYSILFATEADLSCVPLTVKSLSIIGCDIVQNATMKANLTTLVVDDTDLTDEAVATILAESSVLQELNLRGLGMLTDATMRFIGDKYGHCLQDLTLYKCGWDVTSDGMSYLFHKCTGLKSLKLGGSQHSDPTYICTALNKSPTLRALDIVKAAVSDVVLAKVAAASLESLVLYCNTGSTENGVLSLMEGCASLKSLAIKGECVNPLVVLLWKKMRPKLQIQLFE